MDIVNIKESEDVKDEILAIDEKSVLQRTSQEEFKCRRQKGGDQDIDFLETNFTTYKLSFRWMGKYLMRSKPCYIGTSLRDEFINNINNGVKYC